MPMDSDDRSTTNNKSPSTSAFQTTTTSNTTAATDDSVLLIEHISNLKYIEFRDSRVDWTNTGPPLERELYDLDRDPYELDNLLSPTITISPSLLLALETKTDRLIACRGNDCRKEHSTGLDFALLSAATTSWSGMMNCCLELLVRETVQCVFFGSKEA